MCLILETEAQKGIYRDKVLTNRRDNLSETSVDEEGITAVLVLRSQDRVVKHGSELWRWT